MKIFRNRENKSLYTITHLIKDTRYLNNNEFVGIYAAPYKWQGDEIVFRSKDHTCCNIFVIDNFEIVSER